MGNIEKKRKPTLEAQRKRVEVAEAKAAAAREELNQSFQAVTGEYNAILASLAGRLLSVGGADAAYLNKRAEDILTPKSLKIFKKAVEFFRQDGVTQ